jgi:hypothetical protein
MSYKFKGILSFPIITTNALQNKKKRDPQAKYGLTLIFLPGDPQIEELRRITETEKANGFPNGVPGGAKMCFMSYDEKYGGKDYYDPRFKGSYVINCSAQETQFSPFENVVDQNMQPITDPAKIYAGAVAWVNLGISKYDKGSGGIGAWLNAVMITNEEPPMGRLDNKPSMDQMFNGVASASGAVETDAPAPPPTPAAPAYEMTAKANGATRDAFIAQGWTDTMLIEQGYMLPPGGVVPSFAG